MADRDVSGGVVNEGVSVGSVRFYFRVSNRYTWFGRDRP